MIAFHFGTSNAVNIIQEYHEQFVLSYRALINTISDVKEVL